MGEIHIGVRTALIPIGKQVDGENARDKIARMLQLFLARGSQAAQETMAALENKRMNIDTDIRFEGHSDTVRRAVQISHDDPNVMFALDEWQQSNEVELMGGVKLHFKEHTVAASQAACEQGEQHDEATKRNPSVMIQLAGLGILTDENLDEVAQQIEDTLGCVCPTVMRGNEFDKTTGGRQPPNTCHMRNAQHAHMPLTLTTLRMPGAGKHDDNTFNGRVRLHLEVQSLDSIEIPVNFKITLSQAEQTVNFIFTRFKNVSVLHDNYMICCGKINKHNIFCYKAQTRPKAKITETILVTPAVVTARREYINTVMEGVVERSIGNEFSGIGGNGARKMFQYKTKTCKAWDSFANTKNKKKTGLCEPGQPCAHNCKMFPCIAILAGAVEEMNARTVYSQRLAMNMSQ